MRLPRTLTPIVFVLSLFILPISAHADFLAGVEAYLQDDYSTALKEWQPLAEQGDTKAQFFLGSLYDKGQGVPQDYGAAARWYRKAANQGDAIAQYNLGLKYDKGQGVPQDYGAAVRWWRLAVEQGDADAQTKLGGSYALGHGVLQDYVQAHMWLNLAAVQGQEQAPTLRGILAKEMTPAQIADAQGLAREWLAQHQK